MTTPPDTLPHLKKHGHAIIHMVTPSDTWSLPQIHTCLHPQIHDHAPYAWIHPNTHSHTLRCMATPSNAWPIHLRVSIAPVKKRNLPSKIIRKRSSIKPRLTYSNYADANWPIGVSRLTFHLYIITVKNICNIAFTPETVFLHETVSQGKSVFKVLFTWCLQRGDRLLTTHNRNQKILTLHHLLVDLVVSVLCGQWGI